MSEAGAKQQIRQFVLDYAKGRGIDQVADDELLFKNDVMDSLGVFRMIAFLEEAFPITIEDTDMVPENFQSIDAVDSFVAGKLGLSASEPDTCGHVPEMMNN
ncbi:MAG: acyl carrier protein [Acidobacteriales bacterium]|nr:acyl carrier protein [Terriglobales bacterium]